MKISKQLLHACTEAGHQYLIITEHSKISRQKRKDRGNKLHTQTLMPADIHTCSNDVTMYWVVVTIRRIQGATAR